MRGHLGLKKPDIVLMHPPSVFDFRRLFRIPGPVADLIPSGPQFEMYPIGLSYLGEYLERHGFEARIVNLASKMLGNPRFNPERFIEKLKPLAFGIDLHWLTHANGAVEIAKICKKVHPEIPVVFGGYSATIFYEDLLKNPCIDFVIRGDSAEEPLRALLENIKRGSEFQSVPNLSYRDNQGRISSSDIVWVPDDLDYLGNNYRFMIRSGVKYLDFLGIRAFGGWWTYPMTAVLTCRGCTRACAFCGGSAWSMRRSYGRKKVAYRKPEHVARDIHFISRFTSAPIFIIADIRQNGRSYSSKVLELIAEKKIENVIIFELFEPATDSFFDDVSRNIKAFAVEISPETHDEKLRYLAGKRYSNRSLEATIEKALKAGCEKIDIFFMIGISGQTPASVMKTVEYCENLLERYGPKLNPLIGPLAPFLDPGSISFDNAEKLGYRILFKDFDDYVNALLSPHWRDWLSYETDHMSRQDIVDTTYEAMFHLNRIKYRHGVISKALMEEIEKYILESVEILSEIESTDYSGYRTATDQPNLDIKCRANMLEKSAAIFKEQLKWQIKGKRFKVLNILKIVSGMD